MATSHLRYFIVLIRIASLLVIGLLFGFTGAAPNARHAYTATVDRVEDLPGDHYTLEHGHVPLVCIYLRVPTGPTVSETYKLLLLGMYAPRIHGQAGEAVAFEWTGSLPMNRELWFDYVHGYRILSQPGQVRSP